MASQANIFLLRIPIQARIVTVTKPLCQKKKTTTKKHPTTTKKQKTKQKNHWVLMGNCIFWGA